MRVFKIDLTTDNRHDTRFQDTVVAQFFQKSAS